MARRKPLSREEELPRTEELKEKLVKLHDDVEKGFQDQRNRTDETLDNWDLYNCKLTDRQFYAGNTKIFVPFVRDAVDARVTRFANQAFPQSNRCVEVLATETNHQWHIQALVEHYIRRAQLRTMVVRPLLRNGDVEGQYNLYVSWDSYKRFIAERVEVQPKTDGLENLAAEPVTDIQEFEIDDSGPCVEVLHDADVLILPATVNTADEALAIGGSATIIRRWTKGKIKKLIADGEIDEDEGEDLIDAMTAEQKDPKVDLSKEMNDVAGVKAGGKKALVYETWHMLKVDGKVRLCRIYMAGPDKILSCRLSPYWNGRCPLLSAPVDKIAGAVKGVAPVYPVGDLQVFANDTVNEGADTAHFSAMPIVMSDPLKNPRIDTMVLGLGALWDCDPNFTKIVEFPDLWRSALERAEAVKNQIFQSLGVNPAMIPNQTGGSMKKKNQAEIANEQQVDLLTTADAVTVLEEGILTPLVQWFVELDAQFRDDEITVKVYGDYGLQAKMEEVPPLLLGKVYEYRWFGVEAARNAAQMQQQIGWINVVKSLPPETYPDYELDLTPLIIQGTENVFGPRMAPLIFKRKSVISVDPTVENEIMEIGHPATVHPADDDVLHLKAHVLAAQATGDPRGVIRVHIAKHQDQMQKKAVQQQMSVPSGQQRKPGGGAQRGPRPGAQPGGARPAQNPAGAIHADRMPSAGAVDMPRKTG